MTAEATDRTMEADFEKSNDEGRERSFVLVSALLVVSIIVHIVLMFSVSGFSFSMLSESGAAELMKAKSMRKVGVRRLEHDLLDAAKVVKPPPAPPPVTERQVDRVERLSGDVTSEVVPVMPEITSSILPSDAPDVRPPAVPKTEWQPRQEILSMPEPEVPAAQDFMPRVVIPKVERVSHAVDVVPAFDLIKSVESEFAASANASPAVPSSVSEKKGGGVPSPHVVQVAPRAAPLPGGGYGGTALDGAAQPALTILSEAEEARRRKAAAEADAAKKAGKTVAQMRAEQLAKDAAKATKPPPAPPAAARVDEVVVAQEKEAVRKLRDENAVDGLPFSQHVNVELGSWIDPAQPANRYFRVRVASNADNPLPIVSKDIVFLLDASGSIGNDRLKSCREAVLEALDRFNSGDRFNVVAFRNKFEYAFPETAWREMDVNSVEQARKWLSTQKAHGNTDVFRTLKSVLALPRDPARPIVAFVATDGDATSGMTRSADIISRFSEQNGGLVSIFMYGVKPDANAYLMDMLTRCNRGGWACHKGLRWLAAQGVPELAKKFEKPVLTDVAVIFSASSHADAYPKLVTNLCMDEPIEIYGVCPANQKELVFRMRGLNAVTAYESIFKLPFSSAKPLGSELRTEWATRRLYEMIAVYTRTPNPRLLADMHKFASDHGITVPYEKEIKTTK